MHIKAKKHLGQVFLANPRIQDKIVEAAGFKPSDTVLEIGPGRGAITRKISAFVKRLIVVEIDKALLDLLKEELKTDDKLEFVNTDILEFNITRHFKDKVKVIGNIPYYISTPIIEHLISHAKKIKEVFLTLQKEFALRLVAVPGSKDRGSLSCFV